MSGYMFDVHCPACGTDVNHHSSDRGTSGERAVVVGCPRCRRRYIIRVRLVPT